MDEQKRTAERRAKKAAQNRRLYDAARTKEAHVLLRLEPAALSQLDSARGEAGLSRSAYVALYLAPLANLLTAHSTSIAAIRARKSQSLATFLGDALDKALKDHRSPGDSEPMDAASEFDSLFLGVGHEREEPRCSP